MSMFHDDRASAKCQCPEMEELGGEWLRNACVVAFVGLSWFAGYAWTGWVRAVSRKDVETQTQTQNKSVLVQAQTTYTRTNVTARFVPLADFNHGAWAAL